LFGLIEIFPSDLYLLFNKIYTLSIKLLFFFYIYLKKKGDHYGLKVEIILNLNKIENTTSSSEHQYIIVIFFYFTAILNLIFLNCLKFNKASL